MSELSHWECWGWCADRTVSRPEPNSTPERAMELLECPGHAGTLWLLTTSISP
jgi:hypothetical protein